MVENDNIKLLGQFQILTRFDIILRFKEWGSRKTKQSRQNINIFIMALYWFQCKKCETLIKKDSSPSSSSCPKGSFHEWHKLAEVGDTNFQCKKCAATIQAKSSPSSSGCPRGSFHDWKKL